MPELPEVETLVRGLRESVIGRRILAVRLGKTDFIDNPDVLARDLPGHRITGIERYGKYFLLRLDSSNGHPAPALLVHLGMTGHLAPHTPAEPLPKHTHVIMPLDDGRELRYTDPRRFGRMALLAGSEADSVFGVLGQEPLEVTLADFCNRLAPRRARIKALLLDQRFLRGVGNIYADESLWRARIHPMRLACGLARRQAVALRRALQRVLAAAIRASGSSIANYRDANGEPGSYQFRHRVYDREGKPCYRCGARIRRILVGGRSSYFCPRCQKPQKTEKPKSKTGRNRPRR